MMLLLTSSLFTIGLVIFIIWFMQPIAIRLGLVDIPGGRKQHFTAVPLTGGLGIFLGFCFSLLSLPISLTSYRSFIAGSTLLVLMGILDDFHELSRRSRFIGQIIAGIVMTVWGHNVLYNLGDLLAVQDILLGYLAIPFTVFVTVATVNAVNMTDGIDGLAGMLGLIQFCLMLLLVLLGQLYDIAMIITLLISSLLGFLLLNFPFPRRYNAFTFMGDSGSMFLGYALAWFLIDLSQAPNSAFTPVTILWILAIPLFDITTVFFRRLKQGKSPFMAARDHFHHLLTSYGFSRLNCTLAISALSLVLGLIGVGGYLMQAPEYVMFLTLLFLYCIYFTLVNFFWAKQFMYSDNL